MAALALRAAAGPEVSGLVMIRVEIKTLPCWLRRAMRNRHRHAIEQAARRWRGERRGDSARTCRKILISTQALACGLTFFLRAGSATNFQALPPLGGSWYGVCETILTSSLHYCSSETAPRSTRGPPRDVRPWNGQLTTPAASSRPSSAPAPPYGNPYRPHAFVFSFYIRLETE